MRKYVDRFERLLVWAVVAMAALVLGVCTIDLAWLIVTDIARPPLGLIQISELLDVFSFFLLVLIGVELLETLKAYFSDHVVHVDAVLRVALIAIARKVIVLDLKDVSGAMVVGVAALVLALGAAYRLVR
ncbi:MAG: phosphate-starvation-inducible PsiE family protein [Polyangiaceae bacterium]|nr:phosphate-starvation-inducible PsiE family protein [Polyangiaceae bacterium]